LPKPQALVVDDDVFYGSYFADVLSDRGGFDVTRATTVGEALALARKRKFQLVVLDVKMPRGRYFSERETAAGERTGVPLARELCKILPRARILAYSGLPDPVANKLLAGMGVDFQPKSTDPERVVAWVRRMRAPGKELSRAFIVHGRDHAIVDELKEL
jgi:CheY-like chemotaxis protein